MEAHDGRAGFHQHRHHGLVSDEARVDFAEKPRRGGADALKFRCEGGQPGAFPRRIGNGGRVAEYVDVERSPAVSRRTASIMARAFGASTAPTPIEPSPPALVTAAAICGVEVPAMGACTMGRATPSRPSRFAISHPSRRSA